MLTEPKMQTGEGPGGEGGQMAWSSDQMQVPILRKKERVLSQASVEPSGERLSVTGQAELSP
jgi:hypothetical protein